MREEPTTTCTASIDSRSEHGQDQNWISCRIFAILSDQGWIWIFIFEKNWTRYLFDFYNELSLRVIQDVTNDGGRVFFAMVFIFTNNQNVFVNICLLHSSQSKIIRYTLSKIFSSVKRNFWPLRNFWPVIVFQLFCFSKQRNKVWLLLFWCVLCNSKHFG